MNHGGTCSDTNALMLRTIFKFWSMTRVTPASHVTNYTPQEKLHSSNAPTNPFILLSMPAPTAGSSGKSSAGSSSLSVQQ